MHKKILAVAVMAVVFLSGCQTFSDQIAKTMIEKGTGGALKIDDLEKGTFKIQTEEGTMEFGGDDKTGSFKVTDKDGKEVMNASSEDGSFVIKDETGKEIMKGDENSMTIQGEDGSKSVFGKNGDTRPEEAPADLPSLDGASNFSYVVIGDSVSLGFDVAGNDLKGSCENLIELAQGEGWTTAEKNNYSFESDSSILKYYEKADYTLLLSCNVSDDTFTATLQKNKKQE